ncbi:hypothetical protein ACFE04_017442 [Oxalis oulophora]
MPISSSSDSKLKYSPPQIEVESVKCISCGFTEDCTPAYILRLRERYQGRWICGLCVEAVKYEVIKSNMTISTEEALNRHIHFCHKSRSAPPPCEETENSIISVMGRILRKSLDSPRRGLAIRSNSSGSLPIIGTLRDSSSSTLGPRSESCFSSLSS